MMSFKNFNTRLNSTVQVDTSVTTTNLTPKFFNYRFGDVYLRRTVMLLVYSVVVEDLSFPETLQNPLLYGYLFSTVAVNSPFTFTFACPVHGFQLE